MIFARKDGSQTTHLVIWRKLSFSFQVLVILVLSYVVLTEQQNHQGQPHIEIDAFRTPWIPKHFLSEYTFNSVQQSCSAKPKTAECNHQCLLDESAKVKICAGRMSRSEMDAIHLGFCVHHNVTLLLDEVSSDVVVNHTAQCRTALDRLEEIDDQARRLGCEFEDVLGRYDCSEGYSVSWNCTACIRAYRTWVCSMLLPVYYNRRLVKPCRSFCHLVEQRCPYFHPFLKEQYAGEPVFKCIDRNIPDIPSITPNTAYGPADNCYRPCQLNADLELPPTDARACDLSSLPQDPPGSGNSSETTWKSSRSSAGRTAAHPAAAVASLLLWWALGFRQYRTRERTKHLRWREPT